MKGMRRFFYIILIVCLCGCGSKITETNPLIIKQNPIVGVEEETEGNSTEDYMLEDEQTVILSEERKKIPVNTTNQTITTEWDGVYLSRIYAVSESKIYLCQWATEDRESALFVLEDGEDVLKSIDANIPNGMNIYGISSDVSGHIYLLLRTKLSTSKNITSVIREIDAEGNIVQDFDITEAIQNKIEWHQTFFVDYSGNFFIRGMVSSICISNEGTLLWEVTDESIGISYSYGWTLGTDRDLYMTYQKDNNSYIGRIDLSNGMILDEYELKQIDSNSVILAIGQGTDSDLLLYDNMRGGWVWNKEKNELENRTYLSETDLPYNEYILIRAFLEDGRLLLIKNISNGDERVGRTYQYISVGK